MDLLLIIAIILIPLIAQISVSSNYGKYKKIENKSKASGFDVARKMLNDNGLEKIHIVETSGNLTDHYDSKRNVIRLSKDVYHGETISAMAIAAHECGHAIQDKEGYSWMKVRSLIYPLVNVATGVSYVIIFIGIILQALNLIYIGIAFVGCGLIFQLVTLPVEFNASKRAKQYLIKNYVDNEEIDGVGKVLNAAALTYVAGVLASALQILRLVLAFRDNS